MSSSVGSLEKWAQPLVGGTVCWRVGAREPGWKEQPLLQSRECIGVKSGLKIWIFNGEGGATPEQTEFKNINIAKGTTDPGYCLFNLVISPAKN